MRHPGQHADRAGPDDERYVGDRDLTRWPTAAGRASVRAAFRFVRWATPRWALLLTLVLGLGAATALGAVSGEVYEAVTDEDGVAGLDEPLLDAALAVRTPAAEQLVTAYTTIGGPIGMPVLAVVVTAALAWTRRSWTPVALMAVATAGSMLMTIAGKSAVGRARPDLADAVPPYESSLSFPSGHSLNAVVVAGVIAYLLMRRQARLTTRMLTVTAAALFAVTMGLSRVYLGHHWFTDVLVAWTLGLGWLATVITGHRLTLTVGRTRPRTGGSHPREKGRLRH